MAEKSQSVQVDGGAHRKVQDLADLMGTTQRIAASLLIDVADEGDAIKRHHATVLKRFGARGRSPDDPGSTRGPDAGRPTPAPPGPGGQRPASRPPAGDGRNAA